MVFLIETVVAAPLQTAIQGMFERVVPGKNVTEFLVGMLTPNHEDSERLFKNLEDALLGVEKDLSDAIVNQLASQTNRKRVVCLVHAVNKAADLLDEIYSLVLAKSQSSGMSALHKIIQKSKDKLEKMSESLEDIAKLKHVHGLKESSSENKSSRLESISLVDKSEVYGRKEDIKKIWNFLVEESGQRNEKDIPIIAINGMASDG